MIKVHDILNNPFYYGEFRYRKQLNKGSYEPIISKELFYKVQKILKQKGFKKTKENIYPFHNLVFCDKCGSSLRAMSAKKKYKYHVCKNKSCKEIISEATIEDVFLKELSKIEFNEVEVSEFLKKAKDKYRDFLASKEDQLEQIDLELAKTERQLENILDKLVDQVLDDESFKVMKSKLNAKKENLSRRHAELNILDTQILERAKEVADLLSKPVQAYEVTSPENKKRLVKAMLERVVVGNKTVNFEWKEPFNEFVKE